MSITELQLEHRASAQGNSVCIAYTVTWLGSNSPKHALETYGKKIGYGTPLLHDKALHLEPYVVEDIGCVKHVQTCYIFQYVHMCYEVLLRKQCVGSTSPLVMRSVLMTIRYCF